MSDLDAVPIYIHIEHVDGRHTVTPETLLALTETYEDVFELLNAKVSIQIGVPRKGSWGVYIWLVISFIGVSPLALVLTGKSADEWAKLTREAIVNQYNRLVTAPVAELPGDTPQEFYRRRNKLYEQLTSDRTVDDVTLGETHSIPRKDFPLYIAKLADEEPTYLGEVVLMVSSPDWKGNRPWRGRIVGGEEKMQSFSLNRQLTKKFWQRVNQNNLVIRTTEDTLKVQLAFHPTEKTKHCIIRVLEYNGETIDHPLSDTYIYEMYSARNDQDAAPETQLSMFDGDN